MFPFDTDSVPSDPTTPGDWAAPGGDDPAAAWPARSGFGPAGDAGGPAAPGRPGAPADHAPGHRPGGDDVRAARLDEEDDFEEDFLDDDEDEEEVEDLYDDEEIDDDEDDLIDDEDDEEFDFEDD